MKKHRGEEFKIKSPWYHSNCCEAATFAYVIIRFPFNAGLRIAYSFPFGFRLKGDLYVGFIPPFTKRRLS